MTTATAPIPTAMPHRARGRRAAAPLAFVLAFLAFALQALPAGASYGWCRTDPIVRIGGREANIFVSSTTPILDQAVAPTIVLVSVPLGVSTELVATDPGFGFGERVFFVQSLDLRANDGTGRIEVTVAVLVPARGAALPVLVEFVPSSGGPPASGEGVTNQWVSVTTGL